MSKYTTPAERIAELVREHGSYRAASKATGVGIGQLHFIRNSDRTNVTEDTAIKLGLEVRYLVCKRA